MAQHTTRTTHRVSRLTFDVSRLTFGASRLTSRVPCVTLLALLALALALRLWGLGRESLWFDEAYSVAFARDRVSPATFIYLVAPAYHAFLHFWLWLGEVDWLVRLPSALFGAATVYVVYRLGKLLWGEATGLLAGLFLAVSPLYVWYSQEARMYTLATLLVSAGSWLFWSLINGDGAGRRALGRTLGYVAAMVVALYTHSFAGFVLLFHNLYLAWCLLVRREVPWRLAGLWALSQATVALLAIPLFWGTLIQQGQGYWGWIDLRYGPASWRGLARVLADFSLGGEPAWPAVVRWGVLLVFGALALVGAPRRADGEPRWRLDRSWAFAAGLLAVPIGIVFVVSQVRNVFVPRYMVPFLPAFVLLLARGVRNLPWRNATLAMTLLIVAVSGVAVTQAYLRQDKEDWRGTAARVAAAEKPGDYIFLMDEDVLIPFRFYYHGSATVQTVWRGRTEVDVLQKLVDGAVSAHPRVWLVLSHTTNMLLKQMLVQDSRLRLTYEEELVGVYLARFEWVQ